MISFNFNIRNPWSNRFESFWSRIWKTPFNNKYVELELSRDFTLVSFRFNWTIRQSHAGLDMELGLFGYCVQINFYDNRHWNIEEGRYYVYDEKGNQQ